MESSMALLIAILLMVSVVAQSRDDNTWNILMRRNTRKMSLKNYCESWRMNVEINNIRDFSVVPGECVYHISKYMTSTQYRVDVERATEQSIMYLNSVSLSSDGKDTWIFDLDDTLLSTVPYFKSHNFGGDIVSPESLRSWMKQKKAPALKPVLPLYDLLKLRGVRIVMITERDQSLRDATAQNLVSAGFNGWTQLLMSGDEDGKKSVQAFKDEKREELSKAGYCVIGSMGDQWSDLHGSHVGSRTFKLPNCMYYTA